MKDIAQDHELVSGFNNQVNFKTSALSDPLVSSVAHYSTILSFMGVATKRD